MGRDHCVITNDRIQQDSTPRQKPVAILNEDTLIRASLLNIVAGFTANSVLQQDLMQESLVHLWRIESDKPGRSSSWYLQSCQFHIRHYLAAGRSVDSPKRAQADKRIALDEN